MSSSSSSGDVPPHPYVPRDLVLPDYVPLVLTEFTLLAGYLIPSVLVILLVWLLSGRCGKLSKTDRALMCWWAFSGLTHIILEGYFVFSPEFFKEKTGFFLAEVWKQYSKADSRYAARDSSLVAVEGLTVVLHGPACLLAGYAIGKKTSYSYLLQLSISVCQLYATLFYYVTAILDGDNFAASTFYYYAYNVLGNSVWFCVPIFVIIRSWNKILCSAPQAQAQVQTQNQKIKEQIKMR